MRQFTQTALAAYNKGKADGTIADSIDGIMDILDEQEIVSYCSEHGTYSFDHEDIEDEEEEETTSELYRGLSWVRSSSKSLY